MSHRMLQVNENIQRELSLIMAEMIDWEGALVTITQVSINPDLRSGTVWLSVLNADKPEKYIALLNERSSEFYQPLSDRLRMKHIPQLEFKLDDKMEELTAIDSLFDAIEKGDE